MRNWALVACLLMAGCSNNSQPQPIAFPAPAPAPAPVLGWSDRNGTPMQTNSSGQTYFVFPSAAPGVNYVTKAVNGIPATAGHMQIVYSVAVTGSPVFDYRTNPNNTCGMGYPGTVRLFIQRAGDNMSGAGAYQQYRYWAVAGFKELAPGLFTVDAPLDPAQWSDVYGALGSANPTLFAAAVANAGRIGVTFGGGCFFGHGVINSGLNSSATFTINGFSIL